MKKFFIKIFFWFFFGFFLFVKGAKGDCYIKTEWDTGEFYFAEDSEICKYSTESHANNLKLCLGFYLKDNELFLGGEKCIYDKELYIKGKETIYNDDGDYFLCQNNQWIKKIPNSTTSSEPNKACFNKFNIYDILAGDSNKVNKTSIELFSPPTPTLSPTQGQQTPSLQRKCVIPWKINCWYELKLLGIEKKCYANENDIITESQSYCYNEVYGKDIIYECNNQATKQIELFINGVKETIYEAVPVKECKFETIQNYQVDQYDTLKNKTEIKCNFYGKQQKGIIRCESPEEIKCEQEKDSYVRCAQQCNADEEQTGFCGKIVDGKYQKVCCKEKKTAIIEKSITNNTNNNCGGKDQECCRVDINTLRDYVFTTSIPSLSNEKDDRCFFFNLICPKKIIESAQEETLKGLFSEEELKNLSELGYCKEGLIPLKLGVNGSNNTGDNNQNCVCRSVSEGDEGYLCLKYIGKGVKLEEINKLSDEKLKREIFSCLNCVRKKNDKDLLGGYYSGLGCIYFQNWQDFIGKNVFGTILSFAGLFAILCIIYSAIILQISGGNPEKIKKAQELLTSCIMGLVLIIFSVFLLRLIGVDILKIPGFGK